MFDFKFHAEKRGSGIPTTPGLTAKSPPLYLSAPLLESGLVEIAVMKSVSNLVPPKAHMLGFCVGSLISLSSLPSGVYRATFPP